MDVKHSRFFLNLPYPENLLKTICLDKELIIDDDMINGLQQALETLFEREQQVVELRFKQRLTFQQISDTIGRPFNNVRKIYGWAFRKLRTTYRYDKIFKGFRGRDEDDGKNSN